jgi:glycerol-3-phosphate dehydrogenase
MMGTALAQPLCDRGHEVRLVGTWKDADLVQGMKADRTHAKLGTKLHDRVSVWSHACMTKRAIFVALLFHFPSRLTRGL